MQYNCIELHNMSRLYILLNRRCFSFIVFISSLYVNIVRTYCLRSVHFIACANNIMMIIIFSTFNKDIIHFSALLVRYFYFDFSIIITSHHITLPPRMRKLLFLLADNKEEIKKESFELGCCAEKEFKKKSSLE